MPFCTAYRYFVNSYFEFHDYLELGKSSAGICRKENEGHLGDGQK